MIARQLGGYYAHVMQTPWHKLLSISFVFLLFGGPSLRSQAGNTGAMVPAGTGGVTFVGCKSDGQVGPLDAPTGQSRATDLPATAARRLAYYKAENSVGVLAPRGWHCFSTYGSNGSNLFVTPEPMDPKILFSSGWKGFAGPAIQIAVADGGTSGRFQVARVVARVFPGHRQFVRSVIAEGIEPASSFPAGPYPHDKLTYRDKNIVEFETPANSVGLGTDSRLQPNSSPIRGVAILLSDADTSLVQLSARLPAQDRDMYSTIVKEVERGRSEPQSH
ncbi:MAG: hypothetical protein ACLGXA_18610 [Acidobacteriota bacterium]